MCWQRATRNGVQVSVNEKSIYNRRKRAGIFRLFTFRPIFTVARLSFIITQQELELSIFTLYM